MTSTDGQRSEPELPPETGLPGLVRLTLTAGWRALGWGTAAALQFEVFGMVNGDPVVILEHVTRLREDLRPDWPQPAQEGGSYRIEITGEPSYAMDICLSSPNGDHNHAGLVATAMRIVNAIPAVVAAPPGIVTTLDLPLVPGRGLYAPG